MRMILTLIRTKKKRKEKNWNKYSKTGNIDIYGNAINEKNKEEH